MRVPFPSWSRTLWAAALAPTVAHGVAVHGVEPAFFEEKRGFLTRWSLF